MHLFHPFIFSFAGPRRGRKGKKEREKKKDAAAAYEEIEFQSFPSTLLIKPSLNNWGHFGRI
jgi:hypothetical protein